MDTGLSQLHDSTKRYKTLHLQRLITRIFNQSDLLNEAIIGCHIEETPEIKEFKAAYKAQYGRLVSAFNAPRLRKHVAFEEWPVEVQRKFPTENPSLKA